MPEVVGDLVVKITGDSSDLDKAFREVESSAKAAADKINSALSGAGEKSILDLSGSIGELNTSFASAGAGASGLNTHFLAVAGTALAAATAFFTVTEQIKSLVLAEGAAAEKTSNLADKLNLSFEDTKKFSEMAQIAGVNIGVLERASARLSTALEDSGGAGKKVALALDSIGITGSESGEVLVKVLEHLAAIPSATERIALANQILGRGAAVALEPMLKNFESIQAAVVALGGSMSGEMVDALLKADDASDKLAIAWSHVKEHLAAAFAPPVTAGMEGLAKLMSGAPSNTLEQQLMDVNAQLIQLTTNSVAADHSGILARLRGLIPNTANLKSLSSMFGQDTTELATNAPSVGTDTQIEALLKQKREIESRIEGARRSKELNEDIDRSNRDAQLYIQGQKDREAAAKKAAGERQAAFSALGLTDFAEQAKKQQKALDFLMPELNADQIAAANLKIQNTLNEIDKAAREAMKSLRNLYSDPSTLHPDEKLSLDMFAAIESKLQGIRDVKMVQSIFPKTWFKEQEEFLKNLEKMRTEMDRVGMIESATRAIKDVQASPVATDILDLSEAAKHFNLKRKQDLDKTLEQNALIQGSPIFNPVQKAFAAEQTLRDQVEWERLLSGQKTRQLELEIQLRTIRGDSVTEYMIQLEQMRIAEQSRVESLQFTGNLYRELMQDFKGAFTTLGKGIADNIIEWKNWGDVLANLFKQLAKNILETLIGGVFKQIGNQLMPGISKGLGAIFGMSGGATAAGGNALKGILGLGGSAVGAIGGAASSADISAVLSGTATDAQYEAVAAAQSAGGAASKTAGAGGGLSSALGIAGLGVSVASGIAQGIQNAHMEADIAKIEISTRQVKEQLVGGVQPVLNTYLPELTHLVDIWGTLGEINDQLRYGVVNISGEGGGGTGPSTENSLGDANIEAAVEDQKETNAQLNELNQTYQAGAPIYEDLTASAEEMTIAVSDASAAFDAAGSSFGGMASAVEMGSSGFTKGYELLQASSSGASDKDRFDAALLGVDISAGMMRGGSAGMTDADKSSAIGQYSEMLRQQAELRGQQTAAMLDQMQTLAGIQFAKAFEAATAGRNIRTDSTGKFFQLDQAGNLIDADTGKALLNYEQLYNQFANPTGVPTGMQGTQDVTRTNSFGGTTRLASNLRSYSAAPVDYTAMLQNYSAGLNTQYVGATSQQYAGGMFAPITMNVFTNDPQVVANQLTNSLWSSGYKTR